jgi:hypothetical protein
MCHKWKFIPWTSSFAVLYARKLRTWRRDGCHTTDWKRSEAQPCEDVHYVNIGELWQKHNAFNDRTWPHLTRRYAYTLSSLMVAVSRQNPHLPVLPICDECQRSRESLRCIISQSSRSKHTVIWFDKQQETVFIQQAASEAQREEDTGGSPSSGEVQCQQSKGT